MRLKKNKSNPLEDFPQLNTIPEDKFPQHIFIIPDGNRRFAKKHNKPTVWGHREGFKTAMELIRYFRPLPIRAVTLWGFASDNWKRDEEEINNLMGIFSLVFDKYLKELMENNSRFIHLGRRDRIPKKLLEKIEKTEEKTKNNSGQIICLALDFGGEDQDIRVVEQARNLSVNKTVDESTLWELRDTKGLIKSADLIIRTSETRTSDVGWINGSHTVLYFLPKKLFPEFSKQDFADAVSYYAETKRNEGK